MRLNLLISSLFALPVAALQTDSSFSAGLCSPKETVFFSCKSKNKKWINLCGTAPGTLQYRYGRKTRIELLYPENAADGPSSFLYAHFFRYETDRIEIGFTNQKTDYAIFNYTEGREHRAGIRVTTADGKEKEILCIRPVTNKLEDLKAILRCDPNNALNGSNCP